MTNEANTAEPITDLAQTAEAPAPGEACNAERSRWLVQHRWKPGQSGNPNGRPRESGSLAAALRRVGVKPAKTRAELTKLAQQPPAAGTVAYRRSNECRDHRWYCRNFARRGAVDVARVQPILLSPRRLSDSIDCGLDPRHTSVH